MQYLHCSAGRNLSVQCARKWGFESRKIWALEERATDREGWMKLDGSEVELLDVVPGASEILGSFRTRKESHAFRGKQDM